MAIRIFRWSGGWALKLFFVEKVEQCGRSVPRFLPRLNLSFVIIIESGMVRDVRRDVAHKTSHTLASDPRYKLFVFEALKVKT
jgi:hypothetical protein